MNFWARVTHAVGLCRLVHVAADEREAKDCLACAKRLCSACQKALTVGV